MNYNQIKLGTYDLAKDILFNRQIYEVGNKDSRILSTYDLSINFQIKDSRILEIELIMCKIAHLLCGVYGLISPLRVLVCHHEL